MFEGLEKRVAQRGVISYWKNGTMVYKQCSKCKEIKEVQMFGNDKANGYKSRCKKCRNEWQRKYYKDNIEEARERSRKWAKDNPEKRKEQNRKNAEYKKEWVKKKREKDPEYDENERKRKAEWRKNNPEYAKEYSKKWVENNRERVNERAKRWRENNRDKARENDRKSCEKRKKDNIVNISNMLQQTNSILKDLPVYGVIYKFENIKTGKVYIGQTTKPLNQRYKGEITKAWIKERLERDNQKFKDELIEENIEVTKILDVGCCQYHLDKLEVYWIDYYNSCKEGYNNTAGNYETSDGLEEFENILKENNLEFVDGELRRLCDE